MSGGFFYITFAFMLRRKVVPLKPDEIAKMRAVGKLAARTLEHVGRFVRAGVTTHELDLIADDFAKSHGATSAPLGYNGFPKSICTSVNEIVCHGVPDSTTLVDGDIINVDITCLLEGFHGDTSGTFPVGQVTEEHLDLIEVARQARDKGIEVIKGGGFTGDIGFVIEKFVTRRGFTVVKEIGGHGIGRVFHDEPFVPSYGKRGRGDALIPGHCITVEPMVNKGTPEIIEYDIPQSTIKYYKTADGLWSAQFEHTVLITETGHEILTLPD